MSECCKNTICKIDSTTFDEICNLAQKMYDDWDGSEKKKLKDPIVAFYFNGSGDDGEFQGAYCLDNPKSFDVDFDPIYRGNILTCNVNSDWYVLEHVLPDGWENNEGAEGFVIVNLKNRRVWVKYGERYESVDWSIIDVE